MGSRFAMTSLAPSRQWPTAPTQVSTRTRWIVRAMVALAVLLAAIGAVRDFTAPWEDGMRGENAAVYEDVFVRNNLKYGLAVTYGAPAFVYEVDGHPVCDWHWHHPALYPLYLTGVAAVLGQHE